MNILFIGKRFNTNRDALLEKFGRNYQLPLHLSARHKVTLWLLDYHTKHTISSQDGLLRITSTPVRTLAFAATYWQQAYHSLLPVDVIIASGDCYIGLLAHRLSRKLKAKFVFDVYDKYDEFGGYIRPFGFDLFDYLLQKADVRLFASHALLHSLGHANTDTILSNGIDAALFRPIDQAHARQKLQLPDHACYVGYFGSMEPDRGVQDLIAATQLLRQQGHPLELLLGGHAFSGLELGQPGIRYLGNIPFQDVPYALACCDVLAIPHRRSAFLDAAAPNKLAESMIMQRPIVATHSPNWTANFPQQADQLAPYMAEAKNPVSLAAALKKQLREKYLVQSPRNMYWPEISMHIENHLASHLFKKT